MQIPIGCMYGISTYIWFMFMVNVGKYSIHGSYGIDLFYYMHSFTVVAASISRYEPVSTAASLTRIGDCPHRHQQHPTILTKSSSNHHFFWYVLPIRIFKLSVPIKIQFSMACNVDKENVWKKDSFSAGSYFSTSSGKSSVAPKVPA